MNRIFKLFDGMIDKIPLYQLTQNFSIEEEIGETGFVVFTKINIEDGDVFSNIMTKTVYGNLKYDGWAVSDKEDDIFHRVIEI